ncbi:MAG: hypothetical protein E7527_02585 [Ruminococcaceae bacterium]|nr:hypothetical protein [Oscillospiraceae bacterium]
MVVHDRDAEQRWTQQRVMQEEKKKKGVLRCRRWSVLGVQSLACVAVLLLVFVLKLAGGGAYEELKQSFRGALEENQLMTVLSGLFEEEEVDVKEHSFTTQETPENQGVSGVNAAFLAGRWRGV